MKKSLNTTPDVNISAEPENFTPTQEQINTLARRLMPEIKKFFADEQIQKEFAKWKDRQSADVTTAKNKRGVATASRLFYLLLQRLENITVEKINNRDVQSVAQLFNGRNSGAVISAAGYVIYG